MKHADQSYYEIEGRRVLKSLITEAEAELRKLEGEHADVFEKLMRLCLLTHLPDARASLEKDEQLLAEDPQLFLRDLRKIDERYSFWDQRLRKLQQYNTRDFPEHFHQFTQPSEPPRREIAPTE